MPLETLNSSTLGPFVTSINLGVLKLRGSFDGLGNLTPEMDEHPVSPFVKSLDRDGNSLVLVNEVREGVNVRIGEPVEQLERRDRVLELRSGDI